MKLLLLSALLAIALAAPTGDSEEVAVEPDVEATTEKLSVLRNKERNAEMLRNEGVPEAAIEDFLNLNIDWESESDGISREDFDVIKAWGSKWNVKFIEDAKFEEKEK